MTLPLVFASPDWQRRDRWGDASAWQCSKSFQQTLRLKKPLWADKRNKVQLLYNVTFTKVTFYRLLASGFLCSKVSIHLNFTERLGKSRPFTPGCVGENHITDVCECGCTATGLLLSRTSNMTRKSKLKAIQKSFAVEKELEFENAFSVSVSFLYDQTCPFVTMTALQEACQKGHQKVWT